MGVNRMIPHPYERFLGVSYDADAFALLGLDPDRCDPAQVEESLRMRVAQVFNHPDGRSVEGEEVRDALRLAAVQAKQELKRRRAALSTPVAADTPAWMHTALRSRGRPASTAPVVFNLTAFDRLVLSVLVACGGWNARSRAQLVALAQSYGITVDGLLRVMQGLSQYARSGGPRLGIKDIAGGKPLPPLAPVAMSAAPPVGPALLDRLAENFGRELERGGSVATAKLSAAFGIVTLIAGIIALRVILRGGGETAPTSEQQNTVAATMPVATAPVSSRESARAAIAARMARFTKMPTFLGNGLPAEAANAVDLCPGLSAHFDEIARKVVVADGAVSEAVYRQWADDLNTISTGWTIAEASTRAEIDKAIFEALRSAADTPAVSDRLLSALAPPASLSDPLDVWRGSWMAGMLAQIASAKTLPPVVVDRARSLLEITLSQNLRSDITFAAAADAWLAQRLPQLVQMLPFDERCYDFWELWISAHRGLRDSAAAAGMTTAAAADRHDAAIMHALREVLATDVDLMHSEPTLNVAARLAQTALDSGSAVVRQQMLQLFDDEAVTARDLWVLTSLLATGDTTRWFPDELVTPDDADMRHRWRIRDDLSQVWPMPVVAASQIDADRPPEFDVATGGRWIALVESALTQPVPREQRPMVEQLVKTSLLVEAAAALVAGMPEEADRAMKIAESGLVAVAKKATATAPAPASGGAAPTPPSGSQQGQKPRVGQPIGPDGVWAAAYGELPRGADARIESLRTLLNTAGTDLGPIDAALLVKEAYRGSPVEVRSVAQSLVTQQFRHGPNIARQLLDQFPDAPVIDSNSEMIQAVTESLLSSVRSTNWPAEARLALVNHVLSLIDDSSSVVVDALLDALITSYQDRLGFLKRDTSVTSSPSTPEEAAALLLRTMLDQAEFAAPMNPAPADLPNLQRRHNTRMSLAEGPIQRFVAHQLAMLDVSVYLLVGEQPRTRDRALEIMRDHANARARMSSVLEQAIDVERTILDIWRLRLGFDTQLGEPDVGGEA
jgi:hypothetical protein